jgi:sporulation protein YlmC with PRC-barrel domain
MIDDGDTVLIRLNDSGRTLADPTQDVRGRTVLDESGAELGTVEDLLVDAGGRHVRLLRVVRGGILGFGVTPCYVPVEAISQVGTVVRIWSRGGTVAGSSTYDPKLMAEPVAPNADYHWAYAQYWMPGAHLSRYPPRRRLDD